MKTQVTIINSNCSKNPIQPAVERLLGRIRQSRNGKERCYKDSLYGAYRQTLAVLTTSSTTTVDSWLRGTSAPIRSSQEYIAQNISTLNYIPEARQILGKDAPAEEYLEKARELAQGTSSSKVVELPPDTAVVEVKGPSTPSSSTPTPARPTAEVALQYRLLTEKPLADAWFKMRDAIPNTGFKEQLSIFKQLLQIAQTT
jgi:hypothetical protein